MTILSLAAFGLLLLKVQAAIDIASVYTKTATEAPTTQECLGTDWSQPTADNNGGDGTFQDPGYAIIVGGSKLKTAAEECGDVYRLTVGEDADAEAFVVIAAHESETSNTYEISVDLCNILCEDPCGEGDAVPATCTIIGTLFNNPIVYTPVPEEPPTGIPTENNCEFAWDVDSDQNHGGDGATEASPGYAVLFDEDISSRVAGEEECDEHFILTSDEAAEGLYVVIAGYESDASTLMAISPAMCSSVCPTSGCEDDVPGCAINVAPHEIVPPVTDPENTDPATDPEDTDPENTDPATDPENTDPATDPEASTIPSETTVALSTDEEYQIFRFFGQTIGSCFDQLNNCGASVDFEGCGTEDHPCPASSGLAENNDFDDTRCGSIYSALLPNTGQEIFIQVVHFSTLNAGNTFTIPQDGWVQLCPYYSISNGCTDQIESDSVVDSCYCPCPTRISTARLLQDVEDECADECDDCSDCRLAPGSVSAAPQLGHAKFVKWEELSASYVPAVISAFAITLFAF